MRPRPRSTERGFTLVEVLVAAAIAFMIGWALIALAQRTIFAAAHLNARLTARSAVDRLAERLESDASSAWSVFVPATDALGADNGDGHEIDFVTEDASHQKYWWAYAYDASERRVTAYAYEPGGNPKSGDVFDGVMAFASKVHAVSDLGNPSSAIYDPLFAAAGATPVDVDFGWGSGVVGGNHLVRIRLAGSGTQRTLLLASGTAPSHFTVIVNYTPLPPTPCCSIPY